MHNFTGTFKLEKKQIVLYVIFITCYAIWQENILKKLYIYVLKTKKKRSLVLFNTVLTHFYTSSDSKADDPYYKVNIKHTPILHLSLSGDLILS